MISDKIFFCLQNCIVCFNLFIWALAPTSRHHVMAAARFAGNKCIAKFIGLYRKSPTWFAEQFVSYGDKS